MVRGFVWFFLGLTLSLQVAGQCLVDTNIVMSEVDTSRLIFEVEGAVMDDLADPLQGVCKVRVNFEHEFLGDLRMFLTSPAGQTVQLVGNEGNFGLTQFTEWDVCFLPSTDIAVPDIGFVQRWSNNQLWGAFAGTYNGSYYPFFGALEDFNTGSVNGEWILTALDRTIFYQATLKGFEIIFCDTDGIMCSACNPPNLSLSLIEDNFCQTDTINLGLSINVDSVSNPELVYKNRLVTIDDLGFVQPMSTDNELLNYPPGKYTICGFAYYEGDSMGLPALGDNWQNWLNELDDDPICISNLECVDFTIHPTRDTTFLDLALCPGDSLVVAGQTFKADGRYEVRASSVFGCDSFIIIDLESVLFPDTLLTLDTINCQKDSALIVVSPRGFSSNTKVSWQNESGVILDSNSTDSLYLFNPGKVLLTLEYRGCSDTLSAIVLADSIIPEVEISGDTLTCLNDSIWITSQTDADVPRYEWLRNGTTIPDEIMDSLSVKIGGTYTLIVYDQNGCSARASTLILNDRTPPSINFIVQDSVCDGEPIAILIESRRRLDSIRWAGPNGFNSRDSFILVDVAGTYFVEFIGENGCMGSDSVTVSPLKIPDPVHLVTRPIGCLDDGVVRYVSSGEVLTSFQWTGPRGLLSQDTTVFSSNPGRYFFSYESSNGCNGLESIDLLDERVYPDVNITVDSLICLGDIAFASITLNSEIAEVKWYLPSGDSILNDSVLLDQNGWLSYVVMGVNGCSVIDSVNISAQNSPDLTFVSDTINCFNDRTGFIAVESGLTGASYEWTLSGNVVGNDSTLTVSSGGWYISTVRASNGCLIVDSVFVSVDTVSPSLILIAPDSLNCRDTVVEIRAFSNPSLAQFSWTGPGGFQSIDRNPLVNLPGTYSLTVTTINGCSTTDSVNVVIDTIRPEFNLPDTTFSCEDSVILFLPDTRPSHWNWAWVDPDGNLTLMLPVRIESAGEYLLQAVDDRSGCVTTRGFEVIADTLPPNLFLQDTVLPCGEDTLTFLLDTNLFRSWNWKYPDGGTRFSESIKIEDFGVYEVEYSGVNGCMGLDTFSLGANNDTLSVELQLDTITCTDIVADISFSSASSILDVFWINENNQSQNTDTLRSMQAGFFKLVLQRSAVCFDTIDFEIPVDTVLPEFELTYEGDLICGRSTTMLSSDWRLLNTELWDFGWITFDSTGQRIKESVNHLTVEQPGTYYFEVENLNSGCTSLDSLVVGAGEDPVFEIDWSILEPICSNTSDGSIEILDVRGGSAPYQYRFNGIPFSDSNWDRLRNGEYIISVQDANGCEQDTTIVFDGAFSLLIDAGKDTTVEVGTFIDFQGRILSGNIVVDSAAWFLSDSLVSSGDALLGWEAREDARFKWVVYSGLCAISDEVRLIVEKKVNVFVPNVFTPNGDEVNDVLTIGLGSGVASVDIMIFDNWGELVAKGTDITPSSNSFSWDGTLDGELMNPAVFAFVANVTTTFGTQMSLSGSITLLR